MKILQKIIHLLEWDDGDYKGQYKFDNSELPTGGLKIYFKCNNNNNNNNNNNMLLIGLTCNRINFIINSIFFTYK